MPSNCDLQSSWSHQVRHVPRSCFERFFDLGLVYCFRTESGPQPKPELFNWERRSFCKTVPELFCKFRRKTSWSLYKSVHWTISSRKSVHSRIEYKKNDTGMGYFVYKLCVSIQYWCILSPRHSTFRVSARDVHKHNKEETIIMGFVIEWLVVEINEV